MLGFGLGLPTAVDVELVPEHAAVTAIAAAAINAGYGCAWFVVIMQTSYPHSSAVR
jgi:hypothetical protein